MARQEQQQGEMADEEKGITSGNGRRARDEWNEDDGHEVIWVVTTFSMATMFVLMECVIFECNFTAFY